MTNITVLFDREQLLLKSSFAKKAARSDTPESVELAKYIALYPSFKIVVHEIAKSKSQEHYKGLTYEYMEDYIWNHVPQKEVDDALAEFLHLVEISKCHSNAYRYPTIKKWFLEHYPEVATFKTEEAEAA